MREIVKDLFVGNENDYENTVRFQKDWAVVQACKEPYHRLALGYSGRGAPKNHPEYLIAMRGNRLILNLVDAADPAYIPKEIIDSAIDFIKQHHIDEKKVFIHCNQGASRSAGIALLYLAVTQRIPNASLEEAEQAFKEIYPQCALGKGIREFLQIHWDLYVNLN